jgi:hypothetical protein
VKERCALPFVVDALGRETLDRRREKLGVVRHQDAFGLFAHVNHWLLVLDLCPFEGDFVAVDVETFDIVPSSAFSVPAPGTNGNLGRDTFRGPGFAQVDLALSKTFKIGERISATFARRHVQRAQSRESQQSDNGPE